MDGFSLPLGLIFASKGDEDMECHLAVMLAADVIGYNRVVNVNEVVGSFLC